MEYIKGEPYFCSSIEKIKAYPYLNANIETDVLIIGAGIDGCILNYFLSKEFNDITLIDKSRIGHGCTSCATALLEYQLDDYAKPLLKTMSESEVVSAYNSGLNALNILNATINHLGNKCEYSARPTFLYTNNIFSKPDIKQEYLFRKNHAFECTLIDSRSNPFSFPLINGIYCENGGAEFNPYLFCKQMVDNSKNQNQIYENTNIVNIKQKNGKWCATTSYNETIIASKIILATGFNYELINEDDLCDRFITYSVVTKPLTGDIIYNNTLIQDDLDPYHYMRILPDNRIIFGGEDTKYNNKDIDVKAANKKYDKLLCDLKKLFPKLANRIELDHCFCGCFGSTENNLGLIGKTKHKNLFYFFSCGANGILNSFSGADIILSLLQNKHHDLEKIFSPLRIKK